MTFLPKDEKEPKTKSNYTKLEEGTHKLRVLSSAIVGYETWDKSGANKVTTRHQVDEQPELGPDGETPKYFWAFVVYNYEQERVQIMKVTQKGIRKELNAYVGNEAWGDPKGYDIVITRTGTKMQDTEYTLVANPHSEYGGPDSPFEPTKGLQEWFDGGDPFATEKDDA